MPQDTLSKERAILYVVWLHWLLQVVVASFLLLLVLAAASALVQAVRAHTLWAGLGMAVIAAVMVLLAGLPTFSLYRIEGDAQALTARRWGQSLRVPWRQVTRFERPWWAFNPSVPIATIRTTSGHALHCVAGAAERARMQVLAQAAR
jgi:hypothetical protein